MNHICQNNCKITSFFLYHAALKEFLHISVCQWGHKWTIRAHTHMRTHCTQSVCVSDIQTLPVLYNLNLSFKRKNTFCFPEKLYLLPAPQLERHTRTRLLKFNVRHLKDTKAAQFVTLVNVVRSKWLFLFLLQPLGEHFSETSSQFRAPESG